MTKAVLQNLETFVDDAKKILHAGMGDRDRRMAARDRVARVGNLRDGLRLGELTDERDIALLIDARWMASDVYDRCGFYSDARNCLCEADVVAELFNAHETATTAGGLQLIAALHMFRILESVTLHRAGDRTNATVIADQLQKRIDLLDRGVRPQFKDEPHVVGLLDELGWRTAYAKGRHFLSRGEPECAEREFGRALEYCFAKERRWEKTGSKTPDQSQHILFWIGTVMSALARAALEQGRLERAKRQLLVAGSILCSTNDEIGTASADYMLGGIYRQLGDKDRAIEHLHAAIEKFRIHEHQRFLRRASHELVKVYLNHSDWGRAKTVLDDLKELHAVRLFQESGAGRLRGEATEELLWTRLKLATGDIREAETRADQWLSRGGNHFNDLRIQAHAVLAEIHLANNRYADAGRQCSQGLDIKPVDPTDHAWLMLILTEVCLRRKHIDGAKTWFKQWQDLGKRVENSILKERAARLETELDAELDSFYLSYLDPRDVNYDEISLELRDVLVRRVRILKRGCTLEEQARALGVTRQTLTAWINDLRKREKSDD